MIAAMDKKVESKKRNSLLLGSGRVELMAPASARRMEDRFDQTRRGLAAARRASRLVGAGPDCARPADSPMVEREVSGSAAAEMDADGGAAFEALIAPFTIAGFFRAQEAAARPVLMRGPAQRFAKLAPWPELNALLTTGRLEAADVRLVVNGADLAPRLYTATALGTGGRQRDDRPARVDGRKLHSLTAEGATLIIDEAERYLAAVGELAKSFETALASYSRVNLYASWRAMPGFETHWDDHDVFVVQAEGEKIWRVLGPTRVWPTREDTVLDESPPATPLWTGRVTAGDVLFIPRGWWHDARVPAEADGRGSVHLTCQVRAPSGRELLSWLGDRLQSEVLFRRPAPVWAGEQAFGEYLEQFRALVETELEGVEAGEFAADLRSRWTESAAPGIAAWAEPWRDPAWPRYRLRLPGRAHAVCAEEGGRLRLTANGWSHTLESRAAGMIRALLAKDEPSVEAIRNAGAADGAEPREIDALLKLWIARGVLRAVEPVE